MADEEQHAQLRRGLTFAQAEGVEPLPRHLSLREISKSLRSSVWYVFVKLIPSRSSSMGGIDPWVAEPWDAILQDKLVFFEHGMLDDFRNAHKYQMRALRDVVENGSYIEFFGLL
jgi:hypothetical protein